MDMSCSYSHVHLRINSNVYFMHTTLLLIRTQIHMAFFTEFMNPIDYRMESINFNDWCRRSNTFHLTKLQISHNGFSGKRTIGKRA